MSRELKTPCKDRMAVTGSDLHRCEGVEDIEASCADDDVHLQIPEIHRTHNSKLHMNELVVVKETKNSNKNLEGVPLKRDREDGHEVSRINKYI